MRRALICHCTLAVGLLASAALAAPAAHAAAPVCEPATGLEAHVQPAESIELPPAPCRDDDGDPVSIEITRAPVLGTLSPAGTQPLGATRTYTAATDAGGLTDVVKFRAVAGGETSNEATLEIHIGENHRPTCPASLSATVAQGGTLVLAQNPCTDADGDPLTLVLVDPPTHGALTGPAGDGAFTYTPEAGFSGTDVLRFRARDASLESHTSTLTITVTPAGDGDGDGAGDGAGTGGGTTIPPTTAPPPDRVPPAAVVTPPRRVPLGRALTRGIPLTLELDEPARVTVRLLLDRATARRLGVDRRARRAVVVGRLSRALAAGRASLAVKLSAKARRKLRGVRTVRLKLETTVTDAAGNARRITRTVALRR